MRKWLLSIAMLVIFLSGSCLLHAQDSAAMTGVVTDSTGAVIPDVTVTLTNKKVGSTFTQTTDARGEYRFANVPPGDGYDAVFTGSGFATLDVHGLPLNVGTTRTQNAKLAPGTIEQVDVSAANTQVTIDTNDATIGNNIDVHQLNELPVQDRTNGISTLFYLQPGVDSNSGAVTGARIDQSSVTVDGLDVNDIAAGTTFAIVATAPVDSIEQFTGSVAGLVPSTGTGSGAQFQLVTKNGTNSFHGNVNEYHRDTTTAANSYFNNLVGLPRTPLIRNQFGGNIGGPISIPHVYNGHDKLFFFFDFADSRIIQSSTTERTVPLSSFYAGTLNYINSGAGCDDSSRLNTTPNCITALTSAQVAALDPAGMGFNPDVISFLKGRYPAANDLTRGDGVNTGGYRFTYPTPDIDTTYVARIDYNLSSKHKIFGRFTINRENSTESLPEFPTDPITHPFIDRSYSYVVSHIWNIGNNKVNQVYYGDTISKFDFPDLYNPTGVAQYSFSGLDGPYTAFDGQKRRVPIPMVRDDFNWQIKSHNLNFGGTFKFIKTNSNLINNFNFVDAGLQGSALDGGLDSSVRPPDIYTSANGVALNDYDQLFATSLGVIGQVSTNFDYTNTGAATALGTGGPRAYRYYQTELYVGDTWKVNPKLTLSYGVRYQFYSVPYEAHGNESVESFGSNTHNQSTLDAFVKNRLAQNASGDTSNTSLPFYSVVLGGKVNHGPDIYQPSYKDFAPRFAFAYNPNPKTVVNGSAAIVYDRSVINAINFLQDQISFLFSNTQVNPFGASSPAGSLAADPRLGSGLAYNPNLNPAPLALNVPYVPYVDSTQTPNGLANGNINFVVNPNLKDPYSIALNAGVQQEFPGHLVMKLNYVGRLGRRLLATADAGQVFDFPDKTSGQKLSQAFGNLTTQLRAGGDFTTVSPQPWFENVLAPGTGAGIGFPSNTSLVARLIGQLGNRGDISDSLQTLAFYTYFEGLTGFLPTNVGIPSQFGADPYLTNQGNSNYHGLLLTVDKNLSDGLRFNFNYTWSHSIDNTSLSSNNNALFTATGLICDILQPRACRGSSDFDLRQVVSSNVTYDLPVGRGKPLLGSSSRLLDEAVGGWSVSAIPGYRTGVAVNIYSDAFLASFENLDPAIFTGSNKRDLRAQVNQSNGTVYMFAGGAAGAAKVGSEFRGPIGLEYGQRNIASGPGAFTLDAGLAKTFPIINDKLNVRFRADAFNVLNHTVFLAPGESPTSAGPGSINIVTQASPLGQITSTPTGDNAGARRVAQFSLRVEF